MSRQLQLNLIAYLFRVVLFRRQVTCMKPQMKNMFNIMKHEDKKIKLFFICNYYK